MIFTFPKAGHIHLKNIEADFLKRDELIHLVGIAGEVLHRGSLKNLVSPNRVLLQGFDGVREWGQKLVTLLSQHRIDLLSGNVHFVCALADVQGNVNVAIAESPL